MDLVRTFAAAVCTALVLAATPASAAETSAAEKLRRLDIMLMVTSLRCRMSADNFQPEYQRFSANHWSTLNDAARTLEAGLAISQGRQGARRALDRISVRMANEYGQGHPWLECGELKQITSDLAGTRDPASLHRAASALLATSPAEGERFAAR